MTIKRLLEKISGLKYVRYEFTDRVNRKDVFLYEDRRGCLWMKHSRFGLFKVQKK